MNALLHREANPLVLLPVKHNYNSMVSKRNKRFLGFVFVVVVFFPCGVGLSSIKNRAQESNQAIIEA